MAIPGLLLYRNDYRRHEKTRAAGLLGVLAAFFLPQLVLQYAMPVFRSPEVLRHYVGYGVMTVGGILCLLACANFRSTQQVLGMNAGKLVTTGLYRLTRNPQYVSYTLFLVGYALTGSSWMVCVGLVMFLAVIHTTVLIEEGHLERVFGDAYRAYRTRVPRYLLV